VTSLAGVLAGYPAACRLTNVLPLGNRGGFSGARLWQLESDLGPLCLRCWPAQEDLPQRLPFIHRAMQSAAAAGLDFVPRLIPAHDGRTAVECDGRLWEITTWRPGAADFRTNPTRSRLEAACRALALLHAAWDRERFPAMSCPAVERRLVRLYREQGYLHAGWHVPPRPLLADPAQAVARRAEQMLRCWLERVASWLAPWRGRPMPVQVCLTDVWHDHLLFERDRLTGLVDYGGVQADAPAVDLARMLGSLIEDDGPAWQAGLAAYRSIRRLGEEEESLARVLDRSGVVLALGTWLHWLYRERWPLESRVLAVQRLELLVRRVERWEQR
jgi:Ser/Thr protein kinase RdoA (MazF antagonist)